MAPAICMQLWAYNSRMTNIALLSNSFMPFNSINAAIISLNSPQELIGAHLSLRCIRQKGVYLYYRTGFGASRGAKTGQISCNSSGNFLKGATGCILNQQIFVLQSSWHLSLKTQKRKFLIRTALNLRLGHETWNKWSERCVGILPGCWWCWLSSASA